MPGKKSSAKMATLEELFQDINRKYVKIPQNEKKINNAVLQQALEMLLKRMEKCDRLFSSMTPRLEYLGSYFDGLRVGQPTEYDINIIFKIPVNYEKIVLDASETPDGYTTIRMPSEFRRLLKKEETACKGFEHTELWCDEKYRLSVMRFRSWMQKVVDAAISTFPKPYGKHVININKMLYEISAKIQGPANTLTLTRNGKVIDIDLVPAIAFQLPKQPSNSKVEFSKVTPTKLDLYFVVPKPNGQDFSWRLAFPFQERFYINNRNNLKSALKMIKLFRDVQGFKKLASYYIKTLFVWESANQNDEFWKHNSLSYLVTYMLKKLKACLTEGRISNFWCSDHNLLDKIKMDTCKNWSNRLSNIIDDIEQNQHTNPYVIYKYFVDNNTIYSDLTALESTSRNIICKKKKTRKNKDCKIIVKK